MVNKKAIRIIEDEDLDIICGISRDDKKPFCIVGGWDDVATLVAEYNKLDHVVEDGDIRTDSESGKFLGDMGKERWDATPPYLVPKGMKDFGDILGDGWGFSDEYARCDDTGEIIRTSPDSYGWTPDFWMDDDDEIVCDVEANADDYVESCLNQTKNCNLVDVTKHGFVKLDEDFATGLYDHTNDDPEKIIEMMNDEGIDVLFNVSPSQFAADFEVFVPKDKLDDAKRLIKFGDTEYPHSERPAEIMKKQLEEITKQKKKGDGITLHTIGKGGLKTRTITPEEFVKGIKDD